MVLEPHRASTASLSGPEHLTVRRASPAGPWSARQSTIAAPSVRFSVTNVTGSPVAIERIAVDPIRERDAGAAAPGHCTVARPGAGLPIQPGESVVLDLAGTIPAHPGAYATTVRLGMSGGSQCRIPVAIEVPAAHRWGIGAMLLGLVSLGVVTVLTEEADLRARLHDALAARQEIHAWLETNPAPVSKRGDVEAMDRDFDAAIARLGARRDVSVVDRRVGEAAPHLAAATALADKLRHDLAGRPPGAAEIEDLEREWAALQPTMSTIAAVPAPPSKPSPGLAGKLDLFLARYRARLLEQPAHWLSGDVTTEIARARLDFAAGDGDTARAQTMATRQ